MVGIVIMKIFRHQSILDGKVYDVVVQVFTIKVDFYFENIAIYCFLLPKEEKRVVTSQIYYVYM